jgi:hypothetical protein
MPIHDLSTRAVPSMGEGHTQSVQQLQLGYSFFRAGRAKTGEVWINPLCGVIEASGDNGRTERQREGVIAVEPGLTLIRFHGEVYRVDFYRQGTWVDRHNLTMTKLTPDEVDDFHRSVRIAEARADLKIALINAEVTARHGYEAELAAHGSGETARSYRRLWKLAERTRATMQDRQDAEVRRLCAK